MERELTPIVMDPAVVAAVEAEIIEVLRQYIYLPLILELSGSKIINADDKPKSPEVVAALRSGRISFYRGSFNGKLNSGLSKELRLLGAKWDRKHGGFRIPFSDLPEEIRYAIAASETAFIKAAEKIDRQLEMILPEDLADKVKLTTLFDRAIYKVELKVKESLEGITVSPRLSDGARARIAEQYSDSTKLHIKDWAQKEILSLREKMKDNVYAGKRYGEMVQTIQDSYGVSVNKAKFLARQETNLLTTAMREERYLDAGVAEYRWTCVAGSANHKVRPLHKVLDGEIYRWDNPPITDELGNRNNPGQDYNCRCIARPIVRFK